MLCLATITTPDVVTAFTTQAIEAADIIIAVGSEYTIPSSSSNVDDIPSENPATEKRVRECGRKKQLVLSPKAYLPGKRGALWPLVWLPGELHAR